MIFRSFPQENEKNNRVPLISVKLISGTLPDKHPKTGLNRARYPHLSAYAEKRLNIPTAHTIKLAGNNTSWTGPTLLMFLL
jgi:hypothetical protein